MNGAMKKLFVSPIVVAFIAETSLATAAPAAVNIDFVTVGNAGNAADPKTGYGAVAYDYKIAKNETTLSQYAGFLNAVAAADVYGLYNTRMASEAAVAGIERIGTFGSYSYTVIGSGNRPVSFVSWFDAARFVNWVHNGQGAVSTETGAYNLFGATSGIFTAQPGAIVRLPTENEWYKAAYYDPTKNSEAGGYWLHANQSDSMTSNDFEVAGAANYLHGDFATTPGNYTSSPTQNYLTDVGAYGTDSDSYYGTNDQAGNVMEWNDAVISESSRGVRGGNFLVRDTEAMLASSHRGEKPPSFHAFIGFRVAGPALTDPRVNEVQSWASKDGKIIKAKFIRMDGDTVVIDKDGKAFAVPFTKLSPASIEIAKKLKESMVRVDKITIKEKLYQIIIPEIHFENTTVKEAIDLLHLRSAELDIFETNPAKKGVAFLISGSRSTNQEAGDASSHASVVSDLGTIRFNGLPMNNVSLAVAVKSICDQTKLKYKIDDLSVTLVEPVKGETSTENMDPQLHRATRLRSASR